MHRLFLLGVLIVFIVMVAYVTSRSVAESGVVPLRIKPTPTPTRNPYTIPGLGKALSNQSLQLWALQREVKTLQAQVQAQQAAITSLKGQVSTLSSQVGSLSSQATTQFLRLNTWFQPGLYPGSALWGDLKTKGMSTNQFDNVWIPVMIRLGH